MLRDAFVHPPDDPETGAPAVELRAFTHGLMPRTVPAMMQAFTDDWATRGVDAWNEVPDRWGHGQRAGWWTLPDVLADVFLAPLLAAPPRTVAHVPNVNAAVAGIFSSPETWARGRRVVTTGGEFPSVLHSARKWAELLGLDLVVVDPLPNGSVDAARLGDEAAVGGTALVAVSHVGFATGERLTTPVLRAICEAAQGAGALSLVDGYHAAASLVVDAGAIGCDLYTGGLLKEGCGSTGNAFLYIREGVGLMPASGGWFGDGDPFGFGPAPTPHPDVRRRFLGGTTAVASLYHAVEGIRLLLGAGLDRVEAHGAALGAHAVDRADALGLTLASPRDPARRGTMLAFALDHADAMSAWLKTRRVYTDSRRGRVLRMAPFVWNDRADVDRAFDAIGEAIATGAHIGVREDAAGPVT